MSFGDCADDEALRAAWKQFCRRLEAAGEQVFKDSIPALPLQRADAFRRAEGREIEGWEAAVLDSAHGRRAFRRLTADELPPR